MATVSLAERIEGLSEAVAASEGRVDPAIWSEARHVLDRIDARLRLGGDLTVVALAGATGSGKSSLTNALGGVEIAVPGITRPTTSRTLALTFGADGARAAEPLLDHLEIASRHDVGAASGSGLDHVVLLDLPDHDSTAWQHRAEVDRLIELVDLLVWVVDPQKYADAALHERYLIPLAGHAEVMLVALNQVDRLSASARRECERDLRALLDREGLGGVEMLSTSAASGEGVDALRRRLAAIGKARTAAGQRLGADLTRVASALAPEIGQRGSETIGPRAQKDLVVAVARSCGVETVAEAVAGSERHRGALATGWPALAWLGRLRRDPLRSLRLGLPGLPGRRGGQRSSIEPATPVATSLPRGGAVSAAGVDRALRQLADVAGEGLPSQWRDRMRAAVRSHEDDLADQLDRAIGTTDLGVDRGHGWWRAVGILQWVLMAATVAGLVWLGAAFVLLWLQLPPLPPVRWFGLPAPTVLLGGGVAGGVLVALLARAGVEISARTRRARARRALTDAIRRVVERLVLEPVAVETRRHRRAVAGLAVATGPTGRGRRELSTARS